ncbi:MAG: HD domain-containing protein [Candidatus Aenigmatarchaeota archaeon]
MNDEDFRRIKELYGENGKDPIPAHSFEEHVLEVYENAKELVNGEEVDKEVVEYAALLHDVGRQFPGDKGHAERGAEVAQDFLIEELDKEEKFAGKVSECVRHHSNRPHLDPPTREAELVWAADKMHASGATGLCRFLLTLGAKNYSCKDAVDILERRVYEAEERLKSFGFEDLAEDLEILKNFVEQYKEENHASN